MAIIVLSSIVLLVIRFAYHRYKSALKESAEAESTYWRQLEQSLRSKDARRAYNALTRWETKNNQVNPGNHLIHELQHTRSEGYKEYITLQVFAFYEESEAPDYDLLLKSLRDIRNGKFHDEQAETFGALNPV